MPGNVYENKGAMTATIVVAASDSLNKAAANYVCDGTADNVEIQAAIDALPAGGGKVVLLEGTYIVTAKLQIRSGTFMEGQGYGTIIYVDDGVNDDAIYANGKSNWSIKNLKIDCNRANNITTYCIHAVGCSDFSIEMCTGIESDGGVFADTSHDFVIYKNLFHTIDHDGISVCSCYGVNIEGNVVHNTTEAGIEVDSASYKVTIIGNIVHNTSKAGINIDQQLGFTACHSCVVSGNVVYACEFGIDIRDNCYENTIIGNYCSENTKDGIYCIGNDNVISNNMLVNNVGEGIDLVGCSRNILNNNYCRGNARGIFLFGCPRNTITGNYCYQNKEHGIFLYCSSFNLLNSNIIHNNSQRGVGTYNGISLENDTVDFSAYNIITNNHFVDDQNSAVSLLTTDANIGQPDIIVANASLFFEGQWVTINDDTPDTENNQILSINTTTNTLTMVNNLAANYTVAQNAVVAGRNTQRWGYFEESGGDNFNTIKNNSYNGYATGSIWVAGTNPIVDVKIQSLALDLSGGATDVVAFYATGPCKLVGYNILYTEASSADAGVNIRVGRYQSGVALDDDYFDISVSQVSKALGYSIHFRMTDLTQSIIAAGDTVTVGTAGGKAGTGEVIIILQIAEMAD